MFIENVGQSDRRPRRGRTFRIKWYFYKHVNPLGLFLQTFNNNDMADTFSQIYIQVVFAVQNRNALISHEWEEELYKYITGIVQNKGQKMLAINGTSNHIHFFIGMKPTCCLSDLVREVKKENSLAIIFNGRKDSGHFHIATRN
jgi:REP element-mobilizing transposase RayT